MAKDSKDSFANIKRWKEEILAIEKDKPIVLIYTKKDVGKEEVSFQEIEQEHLQDKSYMRVYQTSSKEWDDYNI